MNSIVSLAAGTGNAGRCAGSRESVPAGVAQAHRGATPTLRIPLLGRAGAAARPPTLRLAEAER